MASVLVLIADLPPSVRAFSPDVEEILALRPGEARLYDADTQEDQQALQNRLANKLKTVRKRSPYYFRTSKCRSPDGVRQVAVLCEDNPAWYLRKELPPDLPQPQELPEEEFSE